MVETDRIQLNQRFIRVYKLLEERGEIVRNHAQKSKSAFAERILGSKQYGHIVSQFLSGKRHIDYKHARRLCSEYSISISYMIDGMGEPFDDYQIPQYQMDDVNENASHRIMFTTVEAFAGTTIGAISPEQMSYFTLPNMRSNNLVAFNIKGNSMEPVINDSDIVICEPVERIDDIKDNKIYAVKHEGKLWVKYLKKMKNRDGEIELTLISANYLEHSQFTEVVDYNTRIYRVVRKICSFE